MKLRTEMVDSLSSEHGKKHVSDKHFPADSFHDAAAAHALMTAMDEISECESYEVQTYHIVETIKRRASELMAQWGFDSGEDA